VKRSLASHDGVETASWTGIVGGPTPQGGVPLSADVRGVRTVARLESDEHAAVQVALILGSHCPDGHVRVSRSYLLHTKGPRSRVQ
jgi:hypothetical protein